MGLSDDQRQNIETVLRNSLRHKFQNYNPEPACMPFHTRLLGSDRLALYSFIQSLNTNFGTSIFEPVAISLASRCFASASSQQTAGYNISTEAQQIIQNIMDNLTTAESFPNKLEEIAAIRSVCQLGEMKHIKPTKVDIKLIAHDDTVYLIDLKTAKPNAGAFKEFKRTLLEWVAVVLAENPNATINTMIAIPYNPYEPEPYRRWTMRGMIDLNNELKVAAEFWNFIGGDDIYNDLLDCFERVGIELRPEIDEYFSRFNTRQ